MPTEWERAQIAHVYERFLVIARTQQIAAEHHGYGVYSEFRIQDYAYSANIGLLYAYQREAYRGRLARLQSEAVPFVKSRTCALCASALRFHHMIGDTRGYWECVRMPACNWVGDE